MTNYQNHVEKLSNLLEQIKGNPSTNKKLELLKSILNEGEDYQLFCKKVFLYAYSPQIRFHLKSPTIDDDKFSIDRVRQKGQTLNYQNMFSLLDDLQNRKITGDEARISFLGYLYHNTDNETESKLMWNILNKDLAVGINASTINKVFKSLIPEVPYMRCALLDSITQLDSWLGEGKGEHHYVISQEKLDGMFININLDGESNVQLLSRAGSEFTNDSNAFSDMIQIIAHTFDDNHQYHGELLMIDNDTGEYLPREISNGLFNAILKNADKECFDPEKYTVTVSLWDKIPFALLTEEKPEKSTLNKPYVERLKSLNDNISTAFEYADTYLPNMLFDIIKTVDTREYPNLIAAEEHFKQMLNEGKEGTIVKLPDMLWRDGTSKNQIKLKNKFEVELEVKEFLKGTGKNEQYFGSIRCESSDGLLSVNVPVSGFKDDEKKEISDNRAEYIGKIITVAANSIMYSKKDGKQHSLFLPVQSGFRDDKTVADDMERIKHQFENSINLKQKLDELIEKQKNKKQKSSSIKMK